MGSRSFYFKAWVDMRNGCSAKGVEAFPANLLETAHPLSVIDRTLAAFVLEARSICCCEGEGEC